jgi:hypothetical protein
VNREPSVSRDPFGYYPICNNPIMRSRFLLVIGIFAGGLVHSVLLRGAFAVHDVAIRAAITGTVAGVTCLLVLTLSKRWVARIKAKGSTSVL